MEIQQRTVLNGLTGMQRFLNQHSRAMAAVNQSPVRAALDEVLRAVAAQEAARHAAKLRYPSRLARLCELEAALRSAHVRPIVRLGKKLAAKAPMLGCLRNPACDNTSEELLTAVREIAAIVGEHRQLFLDEGFNEDFLDQLDTASEGVRAAAAEWRACCWESGDAKEEIKRLISRGRAIAGVLDKLALEKLEGNDKLRAEWKEMTSVRRP